MLHKRTGMQQTSTSPLLTALKAWHVTAFVTIGALAFLLALLAERVSGHETVRIGTVADNMYITDGVYDPERSPEHGTYRWMQPLAQMTLRNWGPGRLHVSISGVGVTDSEALLRVSGEAVGHTRIQAGQPWTVAGWGVGGTRNPTVTLEGPQFNAPGDARTLGRLITHMEIVAPDPRLRAWLNLGLLATAALLLYAAIVVWFQRPGLALTSSAALLASFGLLAVYRDPWMDTVAWAAPLVLLALLAISWLLRTRKGHNSKLSTLLNIVALTAALMLLAQGFLNAFDSERMYQVAAGLAEYGLPTRYPGRDTWTKYGFGQPFLAVPFYLLGKLGVALGGEYGSTTRFAVSLTNLPITAITCWLLYRVGRLFAPVGVSLALAATYLLATPALNYARTFFSEPAGAMLLLASTLLIVPQGGELAPSRRRIFWAGICLGAMIWLKPAFAIHWLAPGLAVLIMAAMSARHTKVAVFRRVIEAGTIYSVGPLIGGIGQIGYNYLRYGDLANWLFRSGYEREAGFSTPLLEGLGGLLFSPGKSIFLYAPVLLLAPLGLWLMYKRSGMQGKVMVGLILVQSVASFVFNALWWAWTGNFAWGPRLVMTVLPLLVLPLAALVSNVPTAGADAQGEHNSRLRKAAIGAWALLGVLGGLVSIPGAMVDFQVYYRLYGLELAGDPGEGITIYDPAHSPLLVEPGYLLDGLTASIYRPSLSDVGMSPIWDTLVPGALVLVSLLSLWLAGKAAQEKDVKSAC